MTAPTTTAGHECQGYACSAIHLATREARAAVAAYAADGWDVVTTTRDAVTLGQLGSEVTITTARRKIDTWE